MKLFQLAYYQLKDKQILYCNKQCLKLLKIPLNLAKMDMRFVEKFQQKQAMSNLLSQIFLVSIFARLSGNHLILI